MKETNGNGSVLSIAQAIEEMKMEQGAVFSLERINLAELERRTGISRSRLRTLKKNGFKETRKSGTGVRPTKLSRYEGLVDELLRAGVKNSTVILNRLQEAGYDGGQTAVKEWNIVSIASGSSLLRH